MAIRNSWESDNKTYSNVSDIDQIEYEMAIVLFACGLNGATPDEYDIDYVIEEIKRVFKFKDSGEPGEPVVVPGFDILAAPTVFIKKLSRQLTLTYRRNARWRKISKHAGDAL